MVRVNFNGSKSMVASGLTQYDYGQILEIQGLDLPPAVEIHFALSGGADAVVRIGTTVDKITRVAIPEFVLEQSQTAVAYIYQSSVTEGETTHTISMPISGRQKPEAFDSPEDADLFRAAIDAVNTSAITAKAEADRSETAADRAQETANSMEQSVLGMVTEAKQARNTAVENANLAVNKAEETEADKQATNADKSAVEYLKHDTETIKQATLQAEQRVIQLMSTDTRSYFFGTISQRDAATGIRNCDRCSVYDTRADYIYDTVNVDGDDINPEWIKTSDWDALKSVAWDIITGKPEFATVALSGKYKDLIEMPNRYNTPIVLDGAVDIIQWDLSMSDTAVVTLSTDKILSITGAYNGCIAVLHCYGAKIDFSDATKYNKCATFDYLTATESEHMTYTLFYNAGKWDVTAMPVTGAAYE